MLTLYFWFTLVPNVCSIRNIGVCTYTYCIHIINIYAGISNVCLYYRIDQENYDALCEWWVGRCCKQIVKCLIFRFSDFIGFGGACGIVPISSKAVTQKMHSQRGMCVDTIPCKWWSIYRFVINSMGNVFKSIVVEKYLLRVFNNGSYWLC